MIDICCTHDTCASGALYMIHSGIIHLLCVLTAFRAGERHRKTSEPRIQSWRRPMMARAGGGGAKRPTQREAPRARSRAVSVRSTSAGGGNARSAGGQASASTSASGAHARSAGGRASASISAKGANARSAGGRASARTSAGGANARSVMRRRTSRCRPDWRSSRERHRK